MCVCDCLWTGENDLIVLLSNLLHNKYLEVFHKIITHTISHKLNTHMLELSHKNTFLYAYASQDFTLLQNYSNILLRKQRRSSLAFANLMQIVFTNMSHAKWTLTKKWIQTCPGFYLLFLLSLHLDLSLGSGLLLLWMPQERVLLRLGSTTPI